MDKFFFPSVLGNRIEHEVGNHRRHKRKKAGLGWWRKHGHSGHSGSIVCINRRYTEMDRKSFSSVQSLSHV